MGNFIEAGIKPLVNALNGLDFIKTIYSCEGHFDRPPNPKFIPTAYVTFSTTDSEKFEPLYQRICQINRSNPSVSLRMTYDCIFGLFTLSIWPEASIRKVSRKRAVVNDGIRHLANMVRDYAGHPQLIGNQEGAFKSHNVYPCREAHPPCMLVIPPQELACPFGQPD